MYRMMHRSNVIYLSRAQLKGLVIDLPLFYLPYQRALKHKYMDQKSEKREKKKNTLCHSWEQE